MCVRVLLSKTAHVKNIANLRDENILRNNSIIHCIYVSQTVFESLTFLTRGSQYDTLHNCLSSINSFNLLLY